MISRIETAKRRLIKVARAGAAKRPHTGQRPGGAYPISLWLHLLVTP